MHESHDLNQGVMISLCMMPYRKIAVGHAINVALANEMILFLLKHGSQDTGHMAAIKKNSLVTRSRDFRA